MPLATLPFGILLAIFQEIETGDIFRAGMVSFDPSLS